MKIMTRNFDRDWIHSVDSLESIAVLTVFSLQIHEPELFFHILKSSVIFLKFIFIFGCAGSSLLGLGFL